MFFTVGVLKNFANFTGKHLCWSLQLYQKETSTQVFSCEICEIFNSTFFKRTPPLRWLLLPMLLFMSASSFTSPLPQFHYFLTVLLLSSVEEILSSCYHYYYIINIIIAECSSELHQPLRPTALPFP